MVALITLTFLMPVSLVSFPDVPVGHTRPVWRKPQTLCNCHCSADFPIACPCEFRSAISHNALPGTLSIIQSSTTNCFFVCAADFDLVSLPHAYISFQELAKMSGNSDPSALYFPPIVYLPAGLDANQLLEVSPSLRDEFAALSQLLANGTHLFPSPKP